MTAPGVGPITALCYLATIDDPIRFKKPRSVGAYLGLTTRRFASGEIDWTGRISKCGDTMMRSYLYEAANVLLTRVQSWSTLKAWGVRLAERVGKDLPLSQLASYLDETHGVKVAESTIWRLLDRHDMTYRKNGARRRTATA